MNRVAGILPLLIAAMVMLLPSLSAQRRVSPVKSASKELQGKNENRQEGDSIDYSKLAHFHDEKGNVVYYAG